MKLAEATTEQVVMETNAAYGLARDQLQTEQVFVETMQCRLWDEN